jgi:hypothetical protein
LNIFFLKIQDGAHIHYGVFFPSFSRSSCIRQKLHDAKVFAYSLSTNSKKNKKKCCHKFNSKWPLYSRWRPKLNLLVKTTNHLFSNSGLFQLPTYLSFIEKKFSKIQDGTYIQHGGFFLSFLSRSSHIRQEFENGKIFASS